MEILSLHLTQYLYIIQTYVSTESVSLYLIIFIQYLGTFGIQKVVFFRFYFLGVIQWKWSLILLAFTQP